MGHAADERATTRTVALPAGPTATMAIAGDLTVPRGARGVVVFAHGSGSGRRSERNRRVAATLVDARLATLLIDLLTRAEAVEDRATAALRFDIPLLAERVVAAVDWLARDAVLGRLPVGVFGASTGAAAALVAAAERPDRVAAVVSRGGRPDLAADALPRVRAPVLLIVGGADVEVLRLNRAAAAQMARAPRLELVPGAGHLFEEPGALERVAELTRDWLARTLAGTGPSP